MTPPKQIEIDIYPDAVRIEEVLVQRPPWLSPAQWMKQWEAAKRAMEGVAR